ncbi:MAG: PadR family transcriptional regulator [Pararhodobacter sp.]
MTHPAPSHRKRLFDYGELRLLILAMIAGGPCHGYQIIKALEERFQGRYSPSPGVVYPALSWLEDLGYITIAPDAGGRKLSTITAQGRSFLDANRAAADDLLTRRPSGRPRDIPPEIEAGMDAIKAALRARFKAGASPEEITAIAATLRAAADSLNDVS